jgi:poly(3-hydroxybutyrate) depolymerase
VQSLVARLLFGALAFAIIASFSTEKAAAAVTAPCADCVLLPANRPDPAPLVVLLHGDNESARARAAMWQKPLQARGIALLSLACPKDLGCAGSFWRWDGDPRWLAEQVEAAAKQIPIDRSRVWLIGWSGGASYLGYRVREIPPIFAALVFHGGGMAPRPREEPDEAASCASPPLPALFLVGDKNPLHALVLALRKSLSRCAHELAWHLIPGAAHDGERAALADPKRVAAVLSWLEQHPRDRARHEAASKSD